MNYSYKINFTTPFNKKFLIRLTRENLTIRPLDILIHQLHENPSVEENVEHQLKLIEYFNKISTRNVKLFLNDPNYFYNYRSHLNGKTGTMSAILTSGFYILYLNLLKKYEISINPLIDLRIIFVSLLHIKYSKSKNRLIMPSYEFNILKEIIKILQDEYIVNDNKPFKIEWFDDLINKIIDTLNFINNNNNKNKKLSFWHNNPNSHQWSPQFTEYINLGSGTIHKYLNEAFDNNMDQYEPWENHPCYISNNCELNMKNDKFLYHINFIKKLFINFEGESNYVIS